MTVAQILTLIRQDTGVTTDQITDDNMMPYINKVYKKLVNTVQARFGTQNSREAEEYIDAVAGTSEYTLTVPTSSTASIRKILVVNIKTNNDDSNYTKAREISLENLDKSWDWYLTNQSTSDPIYRIVADKIQIAPQFTSDTAGSAGNNQIWIIGKDSVADLAAATAEASILLDETYHYLIATGAEIEVYRFRQQLDRKNDTIAEFEKGRNEMIEELADRHEENSPMQIAYEYILE